MIWIHYKSKRSHCVSSNFKPLNNLRWTAREQVKKIFAFTVNVWRIDQGSMKQNLTMQWEVGLDLLGNNNTLPVLRVRGNMRRRNAAGQRAKIRPNVTADNNVWLFIFSHSKLDIMTWRSSTQSIWSSYLSLHPPSLPLKPDLPWFTGYAFNKVLLYSSQQLPESHKTSVN